MSKFLEKTLHIQKIIMYIIIIGLFSNNLEYQHISSIISQIIAFMAYIILILFRLHDIGKSVINILYIVGVNDTLRMYKNDDIRMYNFNCITDTIVEVITTCNTYTLLTVHLL